MGQPSALVVPHFAEPLSAVAIHSADYVLRPLELRDLPTFVELVIQENGTRYPDSGEALALQLLPDDRGIIPLSPFGKSTARKHVLAFYRKRELLAFTVATEKTDYSVKFGPSVVLPKYRGRGIGPLMRLTAESLFARQGYGTFFSTCQASNRPVRKYLSKIGYRAIGRLDAHYAPWVAELVFVKSNVGPQNLFAPHTALIGVAGCHPKRGGAARLDLVFSTSPVTPYSPEEILEESLATTCAYQHRRIYVRTPAILSMDTALRRMGFTQESSVYGGAAVYGMTVLPA